MRKVPDTKKPIRKNNNLLEKTLDINKPIRKNNTLLKKVSDTNKSTGTTHRKEQQSTKKNIRYKQIY